MTYLAVDENRAIDLVRALRHAAIQVDPIEQLVIDAQAQADLALPVLLLLDEMQAGLRQAAAVAERAVLRVAEYRLATVRFTPVPLRTPEPVIALPQVTDQSMPVLDTSWSLPWNESPSTPWNLVHQEASHNSFQSPGAIARLASHGVHTFELDIHRGAPTDFTPDSAPDSFVSPLLPIVRDHFDHAGGRDDDWRVYHVTGDTDSAYEFLSDGLTAVAVIESRQPITIFIDNKDPFGGTHSVDQLDELLDSTFGSRLFTPSDLLARNAGAQTLHDAIAAAGWPTVRELEGRVMVVLTDHTGGSGEVSSSTFVARTPTMQATGQGVTHVPDLNVVFYNVHAANISSEDIAAVGQGGNVVRTFGNPPCAPSGSSASGSGNPNYRASDLVFSDGGQPAMCVSPGPRPPEGTPVPVIER